MGALGSGQTVVLRDARASDLGNYVHWQAAGLWQRFDAPWERRLDNAEAAAERFRWLFLDEPRPVPRQRAIVARTGGEVGEAVGWVVRYGHEEDRFPEAWKVGINIGEDACLDRGMGTEALGLWVDYLFTHSEVHRIGFSTYDFNPRMVAVGRKLGFCHEGTDREVIHWQGRWVDRLHFGVLRSEWLARPR